MRKLTFKGGIHPEDNKKMTNKKPIRILPPSELMYFPLSQHIGAPLKPLVNVGDDVKMYQKIADSDQFMSAPLHSSVSGKVKEIGMHMHPTGMLKETIVIENDGLDTKAEPINIQNPETLTKKDILAIIREAGIVGMGGASFPTHVKLSPPPEKKIEYLIVNGAECEPVLTSDHRVMLETPDDVVFGLSMVKKIFPDAQATIAIEENKPDAIKTISQTAEHYDGITVSVLKKKYPQGSEKHIIYAVTKREVPSGGLPMDVGCVVMNIDTVAAIARAVRDGQPLTRRIVTISGSAIKDPSNFSVRTGTRLTDVVEAAGGLTENPTKIIMGGPMMGISTYTYDVPVVKSTSAILFITDKDMDKRPPTQCIRCGKCVSACPMRLMPAELCTFADKYDLEKCSEYNILDCIECGSCSFVCPAKRHIVQSIRAGKQRLRDKQAAERKK